MQRLRFVGVLLVSIVAAASAHGAPGDRTTRVVSNPVGSGFETFQGASADGSRVWFHTVDAIPGTGDTDTRNDVYERRSDGSVRLISNPDSGLEEFFVWASPDGSRVIFESSDPSDGEAAGSSFRKAFERRSSGERVRLTPPFVSATRFEPTNDGSRLYFATFDQVPGAGDTDATQDVYEWSAAGYRLVSTGTTQSTSFQLDSLNVADDGSRVWFQTREARPSAGDTDTEEDVFERTADGAIRLVSGAAPNLQDARFVGASADGSRVWFAAGDPQPDPTSGFAIRGLYENASGVNRTIITFPTATFAAPFIGGSTDGQRVFFQTDQSVPGTGDSDATFDVFVQEADGTTRLLSHGSLAATVISSAKGYANDRVWYTTASPSLLSGDLDNQSDVYEATTNGSRFVVSRGSALAATFAGRSTDASRIYFSTSSQLTELGDLDTADDVYEWSRSENVVRLVTPGFANVDAAFVGANDDGSRAWFRTVEGIPGTGDSDIGEDIYERAWGVPEFTTPPSRSAGNTVGTTLTCQGEAAVGEGLSPITRQWLRDGTSIAGATLPTYALAPSDAGTSVGCQVSVSNSIGTGSSASNAVTTAPFLALRAAVSGFPIRGTRLSCPAEVLGVTSSTFVWQRGTKVVARTARYRIAAADLGKRLTCRLTATGPGGTLTTTSPTRLIPAVCRVPRTRGLALTAARTLLGNRGCRVRVVRATDTGVAKGRALGTTPATGAVRPNGATITLRVRR